MLETLKKIYTRPLYIIITIIIFSLVSVFAITLPNFSFIGSVFVNFGVIEGFKSILNLLGSIKTNFTTISATLVFLIALFFGINVSLMTYYFKKYKAMKESGGTAISTFGLVFGILGIGCASCGSIILVPILSILGISGLLTFLPFKGEEFAFIGLALLIYSSYLLLKKIKEPITCSI